MLLCLLAGGMVQAADFDTFVLQYSSARAEEGAVYLDVSLGLPPDDGIEKSLKGGSVLKFTVSAEVSRERFLLPDKKAFSRDYIWYLRYDNLTRQYMMLEEARAAFRTRDLREMLDRLLGDIRLICAFRTEKGAGYRIGVTVSLTRESSAKWPEQSLLFMPKDVVKPLKFIEEAAY